MKIGINILYLIPGKVGGTETYARELIPHLAKDIQLILFCGKETASTFKEMANIKIVTLPIYSHNRVLRLLSEQILLPILCSSYKVDALFSLGYSAPILHPCPSVVTIHDLNWYYHPEDFNAISRFIWKVLTISSARYSDHVITDSQSSAKSIINVLRIDKSKVTSILHGTPTKESAIKSKPQRSYIFTVLANYPHKNLDTLLKVFAVVSRTYKNLDLIVCGLGKQPRSRSHIKYLGYISREELASLYSNATVFAFPSAYEGFGYPVLEAMSYGAPVVSSNAYSLAEVVGEGGALVNPYHVDAYVKEISNIIDNNEYRNKLIARGKIRANELKWEYTAKNTLKTLRSQ